jgi:site-specific DNA recombinase
VPPTTPVHTVLYGRTSLDRSEGRSVDAQLTELRRWAAHATIDGRPVEVVAELRDDGRSASRYATRSRPGWQQAQDLILDGRVDALAVWEASRASRDRSVWTALIAALADRGAVFVAGGKVHDPADPDDGFMLDLQAGLAVREAGVISKRTLRGKASCAAAGRPHGIVNYGYGIEHDVDTGRPIRRLIDLEQAEVVQEIARRLLAGESASSIARDLNARGVRNARGGSWVGGNITQMIQRPAYAGLRVHQGRTLDVPGTWEPILTVDQHRRLVALLTDPSRKSVRTGEHVRHLLVGVATCGVCGGRIRALTVKRKTGPVVAYNCAAKFCVTRLAAEVDKLVEAVVLGLLAREDLAAALAADDPTASAAAEEVARLKAKIEQGRRMVADDRLSLESLADIEARTRPRIAELERHARPRHVPAVVLDTAGPDAARRWAALPVAAHREIVRVLMEIKIHKSVRRNGAEPPDLRSIEITPRR